MVILKIIILGFLAVSIFDAFGAILSREIKFNYAWLSIGSLFIYGNVALYGFELNSNSLITGVLISFTIGFFDATVGLLISKKLRANIGKLKTNAIVLSSKTIFSVSIFAAVIGLISILIFK